MLDCKLAIWARNFDVNHTSKEKEIMNNQKFLNLIKKFKPCDAAIDWIKSLPESSLEEIWEACERPDWLYWLVDQVQIEKKLIVLSACEIARTVLYLIPKEELRPLKAIEAAEGWCRGEVSIDQAVEATRDATKAVENAIEVAHVTSRNQASDAYDVVSACRAARSASRTPWIASSATAASDVQYFAASTSLADSTKKQYCMIIRKHISWREIENSLIG
jgi:hypothetical protein